MNDMQPYGCLSSQSSYDGKTHPTAPREERSVRGDRDALLRYLRRWKRVRFSIFLCFFLRMRLRRFLISDPMAAQRVVV